MSNLDIGIFNEITNDNVLSNKIKEGDIYHLYPLRIPKDTSFSEAITYTLISEPETYPLVKNPLVQFNCISQSYDTVRGLTDDLQRIFSNRSGSLGGVFHVDFTKFEGRSFLRDDDGDFIVGIVEISFKF